MAVGSGSKSATELLVPLAPQRARDVGVGGVHVPADPDRVEVVQPRVLTLPWSGA